MNWLPGTGRIPCISLPKRKVVVPSDSTSATKAGVSASLPSKSRRGVQLTVPVSPGTDCVSVIDGTALCTSHSMQAAADTRGTVGSKGAACVNGPWVSWGLYRGGVGTITGAVQWSAQEFDTVDKAGLGCGTIYGFSELFVVSCTVDP